MADAQQTIQAPTAYERRIIDLTFDVVCFVFKQHPVHIREICRQPGVNVLRLAAFYLLYHVGNMDYDRVATVGIGLAVTKKEALSELTAARKLFVSDPGFHKKVIKAMLRLLAVTNHEARQRAKVTEKLNNSIARDANR